MTEKEIRNAIIASYSTLVDFLADLLGSHCEVILHVIENGVSRIKKIRNSHITGRKIGVETDEIGTKIPEKHQAIEYIVNNYENSPTGLDIKTNTFFIHTPNGELIGTLCVNADLTLPLLTKNFLDGFLGEFSTSVKSNQRDPDKNSHAPSPPSGEKDMFKSLSRDIIRDVIRQYNTPVDRMTPEERIIILGRLKEKGVLRIKNAVREVARHLNISEPTVYRYLKELKDK